MKLSSASVKIFTDSTADLGELLLAQYDIGTIPLYVKLGRKTYRDGVDITVEELLGYCEAAKKKPKTAPAAVEDFVAHFRPHVEAGRDIVFIGISSVFSKQIENAREAARAFPERRIHCIDSKNLSTGMGLLVLEAAERALVGMDADQIRDEIEEIVPRVSASFVADTMSYLYKGGKCLGASAYGAAILSVKPQITVMDGAMAPTEKFRGSIERVIPRYIEEQLKNLDAIDEKRVFITHSGYEEEGLSYIISHVRSLNYFRKIHCTRAGCVITSHCGPNALGILYINR